ncbi:MAG TPA: UDP-N-acetylmuramoyl-tripeptide--D-alanyl-D-alanine ligase [Anaerolineae bacterium]|nr:UDP-N-acetylmuramoyl-tripeptide--D-alanyl-D-alanine ligase [Anaerolineae bacterium]
MRLTPVEIVQIVWQVAGGRWQALDNAQPAAAAGLGFGAAQLPGPSTTWSRSATAWAAPNHPITQSSRFLSNAVIDSRQAGPESLFVALPGERTDGHAYVAHAFSRGAPAALVGRPVDAPGVLVDARQPAALPPLPAGQPICILVDDPLLALQRLAAAWRVRFTPRVISITGSVGKTTTKEIAAAVLRQRFVTLKNRGNLNNEIGLPLTVLELDERHQRVVLEMGMYDVGEIAQLCRIARPHVGVVTNVGPVHLERLGTVERIAQAKAELVQALPANGVAVLNMDEPLVAAMASQTQAQVFWYGLNPDADLWADEIESEGLEGIRFRFHHQGEFLHVRVPLLGRHSVHTALRAAAVGLVEGLNWEEIVRGLQQIDVQLRLIASRGLNGATLLDDTYNASPASTMAALNLLADLPVQNGRRIAVLGDMLELGSYEEEGHRKVGVRAADVVDLLVTVGQRAQLIAEEARAAGLAPDKVLAMDDAEAALVELHSILGPGDVVLVKGSRAVHMDEIATALADAPVPERDASAALSMTSGRSGKQEA